MSAASFVGSIPTNYDQGLGPHIFDCFASDLATRVAALQPESVLELAAGTGLVTRKLRDVLPADCVITATDLAVPMLDVAKEKFTADEAVEFAQADAMQLAFDDTSFDTLVCQFGVMFFPDIAKSYIEAHRVLAPGGTYVFSSWDGWSVNPFAQLAHEAVAQFYPDNPPGFYNVPFSYTDDADIESALDAAGFVDITIERVPKQVKILSAELFSKGLVYGNPLYDEILNRGGDHAAIHRAVGAAVSTQLGDSMPLQAIVMSATKP